MKKDLFSANIESWMLPHIKQFFHLNSVTRLDHDNYSYLDPEVPFLIGFENITEFTTTGSIGDILNMAAKSGKIANIIYLSSYGVYYPKKVKFTETDIISPMNYVGTKSAILEEVLLYLSRRYDLSLTILRLFNPYGSFQNSPYVIPTVLKEIIERGQVNIGDSEKVRDFFHISDLVRLLGFILENDKKKIEVYNVGSGNPISIHNLIKKAQVVTNGICDVVFDVSKLREEYDYDYAVADIAKIKRDFNWIPTVTLEDGLALTYQWLLGHGGRYV